MPLPPVTPQLDTLIPSPLRHIRWRFHPLDGKLLLFDRNTGLNVLLDGEQTQHVRRVAPRTLLIGITNFCNLACPFCYRDLRSPSVWRYDSLLEFCRGADQWGVLEVAFGGGEPLIFPRWQEFICELYESTGLCVNFTTNGTLLSEDFLWNIEGHYGQIRLSLYHDNHWPETVELLVRCRARFGVNWLITPEELASIGPKFQQLFQLGVRDFLFLSYKGADPHLHLNLSELRRFGDFVGALHARLGRAAILKLDSCWGHALPQVPRLFAEDDCGAGEDMLSITSDKHIKPCSFHHLTIPFNDLADVRRYWESQRNSRIAAHIPGCARLPGRGQDVIGEVHHASIDLAGI